MSRFKDIEDLTCIDNSVSDTNSEEVGLFTLENTDEGSILLVDIALRMPDAAIADTHAQDYAFPTVRKYESAIALGGTSLVNHSEAPNCKIIIHDRSSEKYVWVQLVALQELALGQELTVNYGEIEVLGPDDLEDLQ